MKRTLFSDVSFKHMVKLFSPFFTGGVRQSTNKHLTGSDSATTHRMRSRQCPDKHLKGIDSVATNRVRSQTNILTNTCYRVRLRGNSRSDESNELPYKHLNKSDSVAAHRVRSQTRHLQTSQRVRLSGDSQSEESDKALTNISMGQTQWRLTE